MPYIPGTFTGGPIETYLDQELQRISEALIPIEDGEIIKRHVEPEKPRSGLYLADGSDWDPGGGLGLYRYDEDSSTFVAVESGAAPVTSVFGRTGVVTALQADYDSFFLTPAEGNAAYAPIGSGVTSFIGRTGAVAALQADYDGFFLTPAEANAVYALIAHNHAAADITSGVLAAARIPNPVANSSLLTGLGPSAGSSPPSGSQIIKSHTNGYTYLGWLNTVSGVATAPTRFYCSQDAFVRYLTTAAFVDKLQAEVWEFNTYSPQSSHGFIGNYSDGGGGGWGGTIWGMDIAYNGSPGGLNSSNAGTYGIRWLRATHTSADAAVGEGLYIFQNGVQKAAFGTVGMNIVGVPKRAGLGIAYWATAGQSRCSMTISTSAASGGSNGDIHFKY